MTFPFTCQLSLAPLIPSGSKSHIHPASHQGGPGRMCRSKLRQALSCLNHHRSAIIASTGIDRLLMSVGFPGIMGTGIMQPP